MAATNILTLTLFVERAFPRISTIHEVWTGEQLQRLTTGQYVLKSTRIWGLQLQRPLARLEVQEVVSKREIQKLALPTSKPICRVEL
ncbi:hypothetical protein D3C81_1961100 [compost metagenome]